MRTAQVNNALHAAIKPTGSHRSPLSTGCRSGYLVIIFSLLISGCQTFIKSNSPILTAVYPTKSVGAITQAPKHAITRFSPSVTELKDNTTTPIAIDLSETTLAASSIPTTTLVATETPLPKPSLQFTSDLLFLKDKRLMRWDHITRYSVTVAENVIEFSTTASGNLVLMLRPRQISANGSELFDLDLLDFETKIVNHLLQEVPNVKRLSISPDGTWIVYMRADNHQVDLIKISQPEQVLPIGSCVINSLNDCSEFAWSPDSREIVWTDSHGIWYASIKGQSASLMTEESIQVQDPEGRAISLKANFSSPQWSPSGRFVLIEVSPLESDVRWQSILDTSTKRLIQVLDSFEIKDTDSSVTWLEDGTLAVAHASDPIRDIDPEIQLWSLLPTHMEVLVPQKTIRIEPARVIPDLKLTDLSNPPANQICLIWLQPIRDEQLLVGAHVSDLLVDPVLYNLDLIKGGLESITRVPKGTAEILWAPDGSGFIRQAQDGSYTFLFIDTLETISLLSADNADHAKFVWLTPELR